MRTLRTEIKEARLESSRAQQQALYYRSNHILIAHLRSHLFSRSLKSQAESYQAALNRATEVHVKTFLLKYFSSHPVAFLSMR
jgi:hypothetical protein